MLKVLDQKRETKDNFSLILEKPGGFNFYPGQYLDVELPVSDPVGKTRIFSISSSPSEDYVMLTYKIGFSSYKKKLQGLKAGDIITSSHPAGTVVLDDSAPTVMLAGGIGIAPHRSMIKWALDRKLDLPITLIYSNSDNDFIFKKELNSWQKQSAGRRTKLSIHYIITGSNGRLTKDKFKKLYPLPFTLYPIFYLAGPPKMVDDFEVILLKLGVDSTNIRTDRFDGY
ncbi:MAG: oxidoreductase, 2Fe-2S and FAD/NAD(P) binding domain-containing protein [Microgenomates group bacterium Gr01-1014_7]|nr:MAG: oxidoreductase, 2Fe-2S and FAD/NAD(P) binding domain-containing protein [Microgenomates group bacterium Gr01-1014_7]